MTPTLTFDNSPAGAWRDALAPEGASCAACGQNVCDHSDLEYQGLIPAVHAAADSPRGPAQATGLTDVMSGTLQLAPGTGPQSDQIERAAA